MMRDFLSGFLSDNAEDVLRKAPFLEHTQYTISGLDKDDPDITVSVFKPRRRGNKPLAGVFYTHGGGQVAGSRFNLIENLATMIGQGRTVFVSVEYRLPPENPPPAALHDAYAGYLWTVENTAMLGIDKNKLFALGVSSGCLQTTSLTAMARDDGKPFPCGLLLLYPVLDDRETDSARQFLRTTAWSGLKNRNMWQLVLGEKAGGPDVDPLLAPARLEDLKGFPPTYITVGTCDVLRDESVAFASQLWRCGVAAELHAWAGGFHGFDIDFPWAPVAQHSVDAMRGWVQRVIDDVEGVSV